jgi:chaperonin GroES
MTIVMQPTADRLIVEPLAPETETASGIIIPDTAGEKPQRGYVEAIGPELEGQFTVGDEVLYSRFGGTEISLEGRDLLILRAVDVLARCHDVPDVVPVAE